jgi:hypothetical protein
MPYIFKNTITFRRSINRTQIKRQAKQSIIFIEVSKGWELKFYSANNTFLGQLFSTIQEPLLNSVEFKNDLRGCADAQIQLVDLPSFPIPTYSKVVIRYNGVNLYSGYLWKPTLQGTSKNELYKFSFFGLRKKYENFKIFLKKYQITSITTSGASVTYNLSSTITETLALNQKISVSKTINESNIGYYDIDSFTTNSVTITNPTGINQGTIAGALRFLPIEWSINSLVSEAFSQLVSTYANNFGINFNPLKIESSIGFTTGGARDHEGTTIQKAIESIEKMCRGFYAMGVDGDGDFFFKKIDNSVIDKFLVGYQINDQEINTNYDNIKNIINVNRKKGKAETGNGWIVAASTFDETSIAKYGRSEKNITIPDFINDNVATIIANNELTNSKEPKFFAKIPNIEFIKELPIGVYSIVTEYNTFTEIIDEMDNIISWVNIDSIGLIAQNVFLVTGSKSFRLTCDIVDNTKSIIRTFPEPLVIFGKKKIKIWIRGSRLGNLLNIELSDGINSYNENINIDVLNNFFLWEWDISTLPISEIQSIKFTVQNIAFDGIEIYIDEISIDVYKAKHFDFPFKQASYKIEAHSQTVDLELGFQADKLSDFLANIQSSISSNELLLKNGD